MGNECAKNAPRDEVLGHDCVNKSTRLERLRGVEDESHVVDGRKNDGGPDACQCLARVRLSKEQRGSLKDAAENFERFPPGIGAINLCKVFAETKT
ncbi:hypothetical protein [Corynebacterium pseudotuberculosis]|uniref:hypothetical protein n=1 Tax=Corynebacterium pseudotuberculosis TaxID=1719 RepID=UPI001EE25EB9|nr:hypothetical protein [Corynebacterium pseudotuberculosis]